mmetsp:Transcript_15424/g.29433  ORF Transcript_15424/g.29433 Transcript_15424/m.29433 type:complete len:252 (-) Transcript_15424:667-1422(-)
MANNNSNAVVISSWNNRVPYPSQAEFDRRAQDAFSREKEQKRVYSRAALKAITYGFQLAASSEAFSSAKGAYDAYLVRRKIDKQSVKTYKSIYNECKKVDSKIEVVNRVLLHNGLEATAMEDFYSVVVAAIESLPIERRFLENVRKRIIDSKKEIKNLAWSCSSIHRKAVQPPRHSNQATLSLLPRHSNQAMLSWLLKIMARSVRRSEIFFQDHVGLALFLHQSHRHLSIHQLLHHTANSRSLPSLLDNDP